MTKPPPPRQKICIGENVLNTKGQTLIAGASIDCELFRVNVTVLDVC